jgi:8-oxo-dGTP pyrophosphatase MutT (NUDIX family)
LQKSKYRPSKQQAGILYNSYMKQHKSWKQINRKTVYNTPHLRVHEDIVQLPNGATLDDYSIVEFNDVIMCVVTDTEGKLVMLQEYRYAVDQTMWNLPAGSIKRGEEDPMVAALRELQEETGYTSNDITHVTTLHDYPTKATHNVDVFRIKNASKTADAQPETSEEGLHVVLVEPDEVKRLVFAGEIKTTSALSALVVAMPELFGGKSQLK